MYDCAHLYAHSIATLTGNDAPVHEIGLLFGVQTYIDRGREDLTKMAFEGDGCSHLLWIDDDMRYPKDALARLLARDKDMVGVNYPKRSTPCEPTAIKHIGGKRSKHVRELLLTRPEDTGCEIVDAIGFGLVLIRAKVFAGIEPPWFETHYDRKRRLRVGEDVNFCEKVRAAGHQIFVDHDLSREVSHIGTIEYGADASLAFWEDVEENAKNLGNREGKLRVV
jgi:hypothetical protein